jgi:hypothetical protein
VSHGQRVCITSRGQDGESAASFSFFWFKYQFTPWRQILHQLHLNNV